MTLRTPSRVAAALVFAALAVPVWAQPTEPPPVETAQTTLIVETAETTQIVETAQEDPASAPDATDMEEPTSARGFREPRRTLMLRLSLSGGVSDDIATGSASRPPSVLYTDGDGQLAYTRRGEHGSVNLSGQSVLRYDRLRREVTPLYSRGGGGFSVGGPRTQLSVSEALSYEPAYQFFAAIGAGETPGGTSNNATQAHGDYGNAGLAAYSSFTSVELGQALTRRSTLSLSYSGRHTVFSGGGDGGFSAHMAAFRVTRRLTSKAAFHAGYGYQLGNQVGASTTLGSPRAHNLDVGVDLGRSLALTRRTTFTFSTGSSLLTSNGLEYRVSGNAELTRLIGRTGSARLTYNRGVQLLEGFTGPVMFDAANGTMSGSLSRRVTITSSAGVMSGAVATAGGGDYTSINAAAGLGIALSRRVRLEAQVFGYRQRVAASAILPGLATELNRQGVRVGLSWDRPLIR